MASGEFVDPRADQLKCDFWCLALWFRPEGKPCGLTLTLAQDAKGLACSWLSVAPWGKRGTRQGEEGGCRRGVQPPRPFCRWCDLFSVSGMTCSAHPELTVAEQHEVRQIKERSHNYIQIMGSKN
ncbi:hypothetical protein RRG08_022579 [Elysia crispata]|uniref:Uncharacterized protein n=1 Tax=Elysia crispata TaxID=231223 RepID=A0AAE0Z1P9_9GAST|nr:hypothetical protein RRG08_022579 [Elysia crispata]